MPAASIRLVGDSDLRKTLRTLSTSGAKKVMRPAIRYGLTPIRQEARRNAPGRYIKKLIKSKAVTKGANVIGLVWVDAGRDRMVEHQGTMKPFSFVAQVLEFGSPARGIEPRRYMRNARESKGDEALRRVTQKADEVLEKEWKKARAKGRLL